MQTNLSVSEAQSGPHGSAALPAFCTAVAERSGDTAFERAGMLRNFCPPASVPCAPTLLENSERPPCVRKRRRRYRSAGAVQNGSSAFPGLTDSVLGFESRTRPRAAAALPGVVGTTAAGGRQENSPALECWVGRGDKTESRRDERDAGAGILSPLRDWPFQRAPTQHASAGLFSVVPAGRGPHLSGSARN